MHYLVEELNTPCDWCRPCAACQLLMQEAAAEIERLRRIETLMKAMPLKFEFDPLRLTSTGSDVTMVD